MPLADPRPHAMSHGDSDGNTEQRNRQNMDCFWMVYDDCYVGFPGCGEVKDKDWRPGRSREESVQDCNDFLYLSKKNVRLRKFGNEQTFCRGWVGRGIRTSPKNLGHGAFIAVCAVILALAPCHAMGMLQLTTHGGRVAYAFERYLPKSVAPGSGMAHMIIEYWRSGTTQDDIRPLGDRTSYAKGSFWRPGGARIDTHDQWLRHGEQHSFGARKLLQQESVIRDYEIPQYNLDEAKLINKNCALDVVARINRACAIVSETIPFYYVDQDTRTLMINASLVSTTIRVVCWGSKDYVDPFLNVDSSSYLQFSVGQGFKGMQTACGVNPGYKIQCFGTNDQTVGEKSVNRLGQAEPPEGKFSQVAVGGLHACAVCIDDETCAQFGNSLGCWGNNRMKQCNAPPIRQTSVVSSITYTWVIAGYEHTCAFRSDNFLTCFGSNIDGQIKMPNAALATENQEEGFLSPMSSYGCCRDCKKCDCNMNLYGGVGKRCREGAKLSAGWYHTCAIRAGCDVQCAWTNSDCRSGTPDKWYDSKTDCFCASCEKPHEIECFGYGAWGNAISPPGKFKMVAASFDYTCAIYADCNGHDVTDVVVTGTGKSQCELANTVKCWGRNNLGQIEAPTDMCDAAIKALEKAKAKINSTIFETPAPQKKRPPCVCTPGKGCDCLSQYPRLEFERASTSSSLLPSMTSTAMVSVFIPLWLRLW